MNDAYLCGEAVSAAYFDRGMVWTDYEQGADLIETKSFMARWEASGGEGCDRVGYCIMDEDGNIFILDTTTASMKFRPVADPDQVLVRAPKELE